MKNKIYLSILSLFIFFFSLNVFFSTICEQKFTLLGRSKGQTPAFLIIQDLSGECESSTLLQIALMPEGPVKFDLEFGEKDRWQWFKNNMDSLRMEPFVQLDNHDDSWIAANMKWKVSNPLPDKELLNQIEKKPFVIGLHWNKEKGTEGIQLPVFDGIKSKLIYYLPAGLYVDYSIEKAFYFKQSGYIILFTSQERKAPGLDTMHGFLIFKIIM